MLDVCFFEFLPKPFSTSTTSDLLFFFFFLFKLTFSAISLEMKMDWALQQLSEGAEDTGIYTFNSTLKIPWLFPLAGSCRGRGLVAGAGIPMPLDLPPHLLLHRLPTNTRPRRVLVSLNSRGRRRTLPTIPCCSSW